jgi:hypothetical protein
MNKLDICNIRLADFGYNFNKTRLLGIKASGHYMGHIAVTCGKLPLRAASCHHVSPRH